jgi:AcrR family transcriptional regulator
MRRKRIVAAARALFREKGYEAASTREIAARAEVGTGTLFDYAPDKRALLMMVFYEDLDRLTIEAYDTLPRTAPVLEQLMHMFTPRYELWGADLALSRYAVRETFALLAQHDQHSESRNAFQTRRPLLYGKLVAIVEAAQQRHEIGTRYAATEMARLFIGVYLNESREWVQEDDADLSAGLQRLRTLLSISINGMLP